MNLKFNQKIAKKYKSESQKIRVMSEAWLEKNISCPCCGYKKLTKLENNKPSADFHCKKCKEIFELKSKRGKLNKKISGSAYDATIKRLESNTNPNLLILVYDNYKVTKLEIIPKYFFTKKVIEARRPLSETTQRAGWKGSNILLDKIPYQGRIDIIKDKKIINKKKILIKYKETQKLIEKNIQKRGWLLDILICINKIEKDNFELKEVYAFEDELKEKHLNNNHVRDKIREELQILRDKGYIEFLGKGKYKITDLINEIVH